MPKCELRARSTQVFDERINRVLQDGRFDVWLENSNSTNKLSSAHRSFIHRLSAGSRHLAFSEGSDVVDLAQRKPTCDMPVSGLHPCRAPGR